MPDGSLDNVVFGMVDKIKQGKKFFFFIYIYFCQKQDHFNFFFLNLDQPRLILPSHEYSGLTPDRS